MSLSFGFSSSSLWFVYILSKCNSRWTDAHEHLQVTIFQWAQPWYPAGKTSVVSKLNIPGKIGWITMEVPGFLTLLYCMYTIPKENGLAGLPWENKAMGGLFV